MGPSQEEGSPFTRPSTLHINGPWLGACILWFTTEDERVASLCLWVGGREQELRVLAFMESLDGMLESNLARDSLILLGDFNGETVGNNRASLKGVTGLPLQHCPILQCPITLLSLPSKVYSGVLKRRLRRSNMAFVLAVGYWTS